MKVYPLTVVYCGNDMLHLVTSDNGDYRDRTLCGRHWKRVSVSGMAMPKFNPKTDCQSCRKQQEALA